MPMVAGTLSRYFGLRFLRAVIAVFAGVFLLVALIDYIELLRHSANERDASAWLVARTSFFRVPQLTERIMPFAVLIGAMVSFLSLSRRNELVIARSAGISAWQFVTPAVVLAIVFGAVATALYNPMAAVLNEQSKRLEAEIFGGRSQSGLQTTTSGVWLRQKSPDGQSIIRAQTSTDQGLKLAGVTVFTFNESGIYQERIEAKTATLMEGHWALQHARVYGGNEPPVERSDYELKTNLTATQVRESFATPESVQFWELPTYIDTAERAGLAAAGYRLQYQKLIARPFLLAAMVMLAAAVSLRFFRFGGVQKMVMAGILSGFLLYVFSKIIDDLSKAEMMPATVAAWLPVITGALIGFVALLYQEDG
ncbi:MAG TPA: LPS export ABC transporter permease LptG [Xanthobacteraceae bacterium]|nr:LPS export ABC transporter permease LptG [Xanthobacteraceae bacterium]